MWDIEPPRSMLWRQGRDALHRMATSTDSNWAEDGQQSYSQQSHVQKKCGGPSTGAADLIFPEKKLATFFCSSLSVHSGIVHFFPACKNWPLFLWGPLFVGARGSCSPGSHRCRRCRSLRVSLSMSFLYMSNIKFSHVFLIPCIRNTWLWGWDTCTARQHAAKW